MSEYAALPTRKSHRPETQRRRIAVVGYGEGDGREHARRLRDHGHEVAVSVLPGGTSWVHAVQDGFRPTQAWEAVTGADVVVLLVPEDDTELVYFEQVAPFASQGSLLIFTAVTTIELDQLPSGVDVATITVTDDGCLVSVRQDATSRAHVRSLEYLQWLGGEAPRSASSRIRVREPNDPFPHPMRRVL